MDKFDISEGLHLDASGRTILSDEALSRMDDALQVVSAGGDPENNTFWCRGSNTECINDWNCSNSENTSCHNTDSCTGSSNQSCGGPGSTTDPGPGGS